MAALGQERQRRRSTLLRTTRHGPAAGVLLGGLLVLGAGCTGGSASPSTPVTAALAGVPTCDAQEAAGLLQGYVGEDATVPGELTGAFGWWELTRLDADLDDVLGEYAVEHTAAIGGVAELRPIRVDDDRAGWDGEEQVATTPLVAGVIAAALPHGQVFVSQSLAPAFDSGRYRLGAVLLVEPDGGAHLLHPCGSDGGSGANTYVDDWLVESAELLRASPAEVAVRAMEDPDGVETDLERARGEAASGGPG